MDIASWAECWVYDTLICAAAALRSGALRSGVLRLEVSRVSGVCVSNEEWHDVFAAYMNVRPT